jgi:hypothetical protein
MKTAGKQNKSALVCSRIFQHFRGCSKRTSPPICMGASRPPPPPLGLSHFVPSHTNFLTPPSPGDVPFSTVQSKTFKRKFECLLPFKFVFIDVNSLLTKLLEGLKFEVPIKYQCLMRKNSFL